MSRKEKSYEKMIKDGYGQGKRETYKPWGSFRFPSKGITCRPSRGLHCNREYLFFSELEYFAFNLFDFDEEDVIYDIREQYPILISDSVLIAEEARISHPMNRKTKQPFVRTVDLLITYNDGSEIAYQVKQSDKITKKAIEKFEIERRYFEKKGIAFKVITDKEINKTKARNITDLKRNYDITDFQPFNAMEAEKIISYVAELYSRVVCSNKKLIDITNRYDEDMEFQIGTGMTIFRHLVIRKVIKIDLCSELFNGNKIVKVLSARDIYER